MLLTRYILFLCLFIIACAVPRKSSDIKNNIKTDSPEYKIEQARVTLSTGDFTGAEDIYLEIYNNKNIEQKYRKESLFNLGMMYTDDAETIEDYEQALKYLRKLLSEFPRNQFIEKSNREIRYIRNQIKRMKK